MVHPAQLPSVSQLAEMERQRSPDLMVLHTLHFFFQRPVLHLAFSTHRYLTIPSLQSQDTSTTQDLDM